MATGDLAKALKAKVRTSLDESVEGFWTDAEIYKALNDGQKEIANLILTMYKQRSKITNNEKLPEVLRALLATTTTQTGTQNLPADYWTYLNLYITTTNIPIYVRGDGVDRHQRLNTYLVSSSTQPYVSISGTQVVHETGSLAWMMDYLKVITDMSDSVDPVLPEMAYNAIVSYAIAFLLNKDENPRASQEFQTFFTLTQTLYI